MGRPERIHQQVTKEIGVSEPGTARTSGRVGLLSIPRYYNYGTQLQLFALKTAIETAGYDCEALDYVKRFVEPAPTRRRLANIVARPHRLVLGAGARAYAHYVAKRESVGLQKSKDFEAETLNLSGPRYTEPADFHAPPPDHDAFVVGSDQLWNPLGHLGDTAFFLKFAPPERRIAYAPSVGVSELDAEAQEWIRSGVDGLTHLSVREETGARLIEEVSGRRPRVVVDPTLLVGAERWAAESRTSRYGTGDYVLQYTLAGDRYIRDQGDAIARALGCPRVVIPKHRRDVLNTRSNVVNAWDVGPREFLDLFRRARFVLTDSFHGTIFSVRFGRPFYSFRRYGEESAAFSRIEDFLGRIGLDDRIADLNSGPLDAEGVPDFGRAHARLEARILESRAFLEGALAEACG
jgi:hypothetical protein